MVSPDAVMLEKMPLGTIRVPSMDDKLGDKKNIACRNINNIKPNVRRDLGIPRSSTDSLCMANGTVCPETPVNPAARRRTMEWLRLHFQLLNKMTQLPYVYVDLLQLCPYFYLPVTVDSGANNGGDNSGTDYPCDDGSVQDQGGNGMPARCLAGSGVQSQHRCQQQQPQQCAQSAAQQHLMGSNIVQTNPMPKKLSSLQQKISYRGLHDVMTGQQHDQLMAHAG